MHSHWAPLISLGPISHCKMKKKKKVPSVCICFFFLCSALLGYRSSFAVSTDFGPYRCIAVPWAPKPREMQNQMVGKRARGATCGPGGTAGVIRGSVSDKTVHFYAVVPLMPTFSFLLANISLWINLLSWQCCVSTLVSLKSLETPQWFRLRYIILLTQICFITHKLLKILVSSWELPLKIPFLFLSHFQSWAKTASNNAKQAQFIRLKK